MTASPDPPAPSPAPPRNPGAPPFAVVVPMYDEIAGAEACVEAVTAVLRAHAPGAVMIAVDDGSRDGTGALLDRLAAANADVIALHRENGGYGAALATGAAEAARLGAPFVVFMDSDLTNPPADIPRFAAAMAEGYDLVKGSRFDAGGGMAGVPWRRAMLSRLANLVARVLFRAGIRDCTNGFRAIRTELFLRLPLGERDFAVIVEELRHAKRRGARITSVPTVLTDRTAAQRPTSFGYSPDLIRRYLKHALAAALPGG